MKLTLHWIDAFTDRPFAGNPAGVCLLDEWLPDPVLQRMAFEHGLSETAFLVGVAPGVYHLRWFTPRIEVDLCGHATLASAHVLLRELRAVQSRVVFQTRSGDLTVREAGDRLEMDFPERPPAPEANPRPEILRAVGGRPREVLSTGNSYLLVYDKAEDVAGLRPDFLTLRGFGDQRIIATAPGTDCDFVSRYFAAGAGIDEDPVTGSAHCVLMPYWARRLGRNRLHARQISERGGELWCEWAAPRVKIAGQAVLYLRAELQLRTAEGKA